MCFSNVLIMVKKYFFHFAVVTVISTTYQVNFPKLIINVSQSSIWFFFGGYSISHIITVTYCRKDFNVYEPLRCIALNAFVSLLLLDLILNIRICGKQKDI